jgi:hypothetical protein
VKQFYSVCIPAPIAYIQLSETCQLNVQHAHVNQYHVEALLTQGKISVCFGLRREQNEFYFIEFGFQKVNIGFCWQL